MASTVRPLLNVRNPRNLEWLRVVRKAYGYEGIKNFQDRAFYYRVELEKGKSHTAALLRHMTDGVVLRASTRENAVKYRLHSCTDVAAAANVGRLLALRCFKSGIHFAKLYLPDIETSRKSKAFRDALEASGLVLDEWESVEPDYSIDNRYHWVVSLPECETEFVPPSG